MTSKDKSAREARVVKWAHRFMILFGLVWISAGIYFGLDVWKQITRSVAVEGTVVALADFSDSMARYPVVRYRDMDGHEHELESKTGSNPPRHFVGEKVRVLIDPNDPDFADHAMIDSVFDLWSGPGFMVGFGAFFVLITVGMGFLMSRDENAPGQAGSDPVRMMVNVFLAVGLVLTGLGLKDWYNTGKFVARAERVDGTIIAFIDRIGSSVDFPVVRYIDHHGQERTLYSTSGMSTSSHAVGDKVNVLIDPTVPDYPRTGTIEGFAELWSESMILLLIGGGFVLLPLAFKYIDSRGGEIVFGRSKSKGRHNG